jgi:hypothetical protein
MFSSFHSSDAPFVGDLEELKKVDLRQFEQADASTVRAYRSRMRYLAALYPELGLIPLAEKVHRMVNNRELSLADVRAILDGRRLTSTSERTSEVPLTAIQIVGKTLSDGGSLRDAARNAHVSVDTVEAIEELCGLARRFEDRLMDLAVISVREGWSVRRFAALSGMSRSRAHRYQVRARRVLAEIGEVGR